jgi:glutamate formiminotransferase / 5-formyltetrahydrofolate cyclo-ligase
VPPVLLECVVNLSEGRDLVVLDRLAASCSDTLIDRHRDAEHHRSVFTLAGRPSELEMAARALASLAVDLIDVTHHAGVHPRFGALDVVPFVPLGSADLALAVGARDRFAEWAGRSLALPCFLYGPLPGGADRTLPEVRRRAFNGLAPDAGPPGPHPSAGACAVGARRVLVAYNLWLEGADGPLARRVAASVRGPAVRALGLVLSGAVQISANLVRPEVVGPGTLYDQVAEAITGTGARVARAELVGLLPRSVLAAEPEERWPALGLSPGATIEACLPALSADGEQY